MKTHSTGDSYAAKGCPSAVRIAYIPNVKSKLVKGTMSRPAILEATRTSTNLQRHTERVQAVLAQYGKGTIDPSDPKSRSHYDTARQTIPALIPAVDCPDGTPRAGMGYRVHNGRYCLDIDKDISPDELPAVRDALAAWPHTTIVSRSVSHEALWVVLHGPKARNENEFKYFHQILIDMLPDSVRPHVADGQNDLSRSRYWAWDPDAMEGRDIRADLPLPEQGTAGSGYPKDSSDAAPEREKARAALEYIPLGDDSYSDVWLPIGMALINADREYGEAFDGCGLFREWTENAARDGSTKPGRALATYQQWTADNAKLDEERPRRTLGSLYAMARENGWKPLRRRKGEPRSRSAPPGSNEAPETEARGRCREGRRESDALQRLRMAYEAIPPGEARDQVKAGLDTFIRQEAEAARDEMSYEDLHDLYREELREKLGVDISAVRRYHADPPVFELVVADCAPPYRSGTVTLEGTSHILNWSKFEVAIGDACLAVMVEPRKPGTQGRGTVSDWKHCARLILQMAVDVDTGDVGHAAKELREWLASYLVENSVTDKLDQAAIAHAPCTDYLAVYIYLTDLVNWINSHNLQTVSTRDLSRRLKRLGAEQKTLHMTIGTSETTRSTWKLPVADYPPPA